MHRHLSRLAVALAIVSFVTGCSKIDAIQRPAVVPGGADFSRYVAMGTSLAAGTESDGTAERHQPYSYANQFARLVGPAVWDRYTVSADGINSMDTAPMLNLISLVPPVVSPQGHTKGVAGNQSLATDFHNLGVPAALLIDVADSSSYYGAGAVPYHSAHFQWVVRHRGTLLLAMSRLQPTFITFEYGANEILAGMGNGSGQAVIPSATWATILHATLDGVQALAPDAKVAIFNVPDPTDVPFARTFSWITRDTLGNPTPLIGTSGPLPAGSLVLLSAAQALAAGTGFPTSCKSYLTGVPGNGQPLPDAVVLTPAEQTNLANDLAAYNAAIASEAAARGFAVVDMYQTFKNVATHGLDYNGVHYSTAFITGGLFSLDGVHPSDLGYGVLTNALIASVNARFGAAIAPLDYAECLTLSSYRLRQAPSDRLPILLDAGRVVADLFPYGATAR